MPWLNMQLGPELFGTPDVEVRLLTVVVNLVIAAILAYVLGIVYVRYGTSLSNRRMFARNFMLLACTTMIIITIVKSSLALSLGLVGALSIVRFRSAIKEPEELAYLFLTISIGLGLGADQTKVTVTAFALIVGLIWLGAQRRTSAANQNLFLTVTSTRPDEGELGEIVSTLEANCSALSLRRFDERPDILEAAFQVEFDSFQQLKQSKAELRKLNSGLQISFCDNRGVL